MTRGFRSLLMVLLVAGLAGWLPHAFAGGWRGDGTGQYPAADPLTKWSEKDILWKTEVGTGVSSPVLVGSRLFVTAEPDLLICLDSDTGRELWRKAHSASDIPAALPPQTVLESNPNGDATPTPISDGKSVWAFFGTGVVACYDLDGQSRWVKWFDLPPSTQYGRTVSPVLVGDRLLVHLGPLVCLDAATGKLLWSNETATATYGTPAPVRIGDVDVVITPKGHAVRVSDGKTLAEDLGHCMYTSPIVQDGIVYFIDSSSSAVRLPEKAGEKLEGKELWYVDLTGDFFASPIVQGGRLYVVDRSANYFVIDTATGKTIVKKALNLPPAGRSESPNIYSSLCLAGKHLFVGNDAGESLFLEQEAGDQPIATGTNALADGSGSTPTFSDQRMFLRGGRFVYCIGHRPASKPGH